MSLINIKAIIASWKLNIKKYFFSYSKGFFEVYIIGNSPYTMIQNFKNMPFVKHNANHQTIYTDTLFLTSNIFYLELQPECVLIISDAFYKKNCLDVMLYDQRAPIDYYFLSLNSLKGATSNSSTMVNGTNFSTNTWSLSKPGGSRSVSHFKSSHENFITVYFTKKWLDSYLQNSDEKTKVFFEKFLISETCFFMWPRYATTQSPDYFLFNNVFNPKIPVSERDHNDFLGAVLAMFDEFSSSLNELEFNHENVKMSNDQRLKLFKAEKYLSQFFLQEFPGVEEIAKQAGISPTALKAGFQLIYGCTLFQYHRKHKMKMAQYILQTTPSIKVKELSAQLGYSNAAKFAAAFKEEVGFSPSQISPE